MNNAMRSRTIRQAKLKLQRSQAIGLATLERECNRSWRSLLAEGAQSGRGKGGKGGKRANVLQLQLTITITTRRVMPRHDTTRNQQRQLQRQQRRPTDPLTLPERKGGGEAGGTLGLLFASELLIFPSR